MAATKASLTKVNPTSVDEAAMRSETESLPILLSRLGDDVMQLFNSQLNEPTCKLRAGLRNHRCLLPPCRRDYCNGDQESAGETGIGTE